MLKGFMLVIKRLHLRYEDDYYYYEGIEEAAVEAVQPALEDMTQEEWEAYMAEQDKKREEEEKYLPSFVDQIYLKLSLAVNNKLSPKQTIVSLPKSIKGRLFTNKLTGVSLSLYVMKAPGNNIFSAN